MPITAHLNSFMESMNHDGSNELYIALRFDVNNDHQTCMIMSFVTQISAIDDWKRLASGDLHRLVCIADKKHDTPRVTVENSEEFTVFSYDENNAIRATLDSCKYVFDAIVGKIDKM